MPETERQFEGTAIAETETEDELAGLFEVKTGGETDSHEVRQRFENGSVLNFLVTPDFDIYVTTEYHEDIAGYNGLNYDVRNDMVFGYMKKSGQQDLQTGYYDSSSTFQKILHDDPTWQKQFQINGYKTEERLRYAMRTKLKEYFYNP